MTAVKITPAKLQGTVQVPPSKSLAHRAIICASLAKGASRIDNIEYSKDIQATIKAMKSLVTKIRTLNKIVRSIVRNLVQHLDLWYQFQSLRKIKFILLVAEI